MSDDGKSIKSNSSKSSNESEKLDESTCPKRLEDCVEWNSYREYDALDDGIDSSAYFNDDNDITTFELDSDCDSDSDSDSGSDSEEDEESSKQLNETDISSLHTSFRLKIFEVAKQITPFDDSDCNLKSQLDPPEELPSEKNWNFQLGNIVKVTDSQEKLKSLQSRILGWNSKLKKICGKVGVVHACLSPKSNAVSVYFPSEKSRCVLYAGVLEKVSKEEEKKIKESSPKSEWELGDLVFIRCDFSEDEDIPWKIESTRKSLGGRQGKIVAILSEFVLVTYNGKMSWAINPNILARYPVKAEIEEKKEKSTKFTEGEEVRVTSNLKKFIEQQKESGDWQSAMKSIKGQKVKVLSVLKDDTVVVQGEHTRPWRVNASSLLKDDEEDDASVDKTCFEPGDYLELVVNDDARKAAKKMAVPTVFLEFPNLVGRVTRVDDDLDARLEIGPKETFWLSKKACKLSETLQQKLKQIEERVKNLQAGDTIQLQVGTPKFVKQVLADADATEDIVTALTKPGKLVGFVDEKTAVVEFECGKKYKVKKEDLTVPESYQIEHK